MWPRCVCGLSLRAAMSSIIRWRSGLTVLVSLMESSFLSEGCNTSILRTELSNGYWDSSRPTTGLSALAPAQRAGAQRLCAMARLRHADRFGECPLIGEDRKSPAYGRSDANDRAPR